MNQPPYDFYNVRACSPDSLDDVYYQTDAAEQQGKWLVTFFHSLDGTGYGAWVIGELEDYLDYLKARDLWVGPFDALVKYIREKSYATLSVSSSTVEQIVLSLTDTLDDTIYDVPLDDPKRSPFRLVLSGSPTGQYHHHGKFHRGGVDASYLLQRRSRPWSHFLDDECSIGEHCADRRHRRSCTEHDDQQGGLRKLRWKQHGS